MNQLQTLITPDQSNSYPNPLTQTSYTPTIYTAAELLNTDFPEPKWAIEGVLPEGTCILGGKPKMGKSILAVNIAMAISNGGRALGYTTVEQGEVLYLALEDVPRRLKERITQMPGEASEWFSLATQWPRVGEGGLTLLDGEISNRRNLRLVIIDTLKMIKEPKVETRKTLYDADYDAVCKIKELSDKHSICILIIHHLRKMGSDDIMDCFSGTTGLTGAADTLLVLERITGQTDAKLHITGRDLEPDELALNFDASSLSWEVIGRSDDVLKTKQQQDVYDVIKNHEGEISRKEICSKSGVEYRNSGRILTALQKDGKISKVDRGKYIICMS